MIILDGKYGEGGGQIVRTALALSALTGKAFEIKNIRGNRDRSGLKSQHCACVNAVQQLCDAIVTGAEIGSRELTFEPKMLQGGMINIEIGTAGSVMLLLQSLLLPCFFASKMTTIRVQGGTDVLWSLPVNYVQEVFLPHIKKYAQRVDIKLVKRGYYPAGGGEVSTIIKPKYSLKNQGSLEDIRLLLKDAPSINVVEQGHLVIIRGISHASSQLEHAKIAERQAQSAEQYLKKMFSCPVSVRTEYAQTTSPGSGIVLWSVFSKKKDDIDEENPIIIGADALGERGVSSENIGKSVAAELGERVKSNASMDVHLADNLIPWLALVKGSRIRVPLLTPHLLTNVYVTEQFFGPCLKVDEENKSIESF